MRSDSSELVLFWLTSNSCRKENYHVQKINLLNFSYFCTDRGLTKSTDADEPAPVGWWRLNGNAEDSSGNNNHGTLSGDPQWVVGKIGGALEFDGVDDHVDCGNDPSLDITGPVTIAAWVYPTGSGSSNYPRIVDKSDGTGGADPG